MQKIGGEFFTLEEAQSNLGKEVPQFRDYIRRDEYKKLFCEM